MPPSIPTSFIPHPSAGVPRRPTQSELMKVLGLLAYLLLFLTVIAAIGIFFYGRILSAQAAAQDTALASAESGIDPATVTNFVRLRDRLSSSETLLNNHKELSAFFSALESMLLSDMRLNSLSITLDPQGVATINAAGSAKNFNALAAASDSFSSDGRLKNAIFSNIALGQNGSVSFSLAATIDPKLIAFTPPSAASPAAAPASASVPVSTPPIPSAKTAPAAPTTPAAAASTSSAGMPPPPPHP